ncbi:MAG: histidine kinase, partial [Pirellulaceae bacterium]
MVLLGAALALLVTLSSGSSVELALFERFSITALFIQWCALTSSAALCALRKALSAIRPSISLVVVFILIQATVILWSLLAIEFQDLYGQISSESLQQKSDFLIRNVGISALATFLLIRYLMLQQRWKAQVEAEAQARMDSLQARIRPHFLFNTLNTIASLVRTRPNDAEQAVLDLADLLRSGLRTDATHTLGEELELVRGYLRIESHRLGDRQAISQPLRLDVQVAAHHFQLLGQRVLGVRAQPAVQQIGQVQHRVLGL